MFKKLNSLNSYLTLFLIKISSKTSKEIAIAKKCDLISSKIA